MIKMYSEFIKAEEIWVMMEMLVIVAVEAVAVLAAVVMVLMQEGQS